MSTIDKDRLRELVAEQTAKTKDIVKALGFNNDATFYYALNKDAEAKQIFDSRPGARAKSGAKKSAAKKSSKKSAAPPATGMPRAHTRNSSKSCCMNSITSIFTARSPITLTVCAKS